MSRIIEEEVDAPIRSKAVSKSYREGYDAIDWGDNPPTETDAKAAVREYLANGGEPSPIGWYGVVSVPERRTQTRDEECSTCGAKDGAPCDDEIHETTGQPRER